MQPQVIVDIEARRVTKGGEEIILTSLEFELLAYLVQNPRRIIPTSLLIDRLWEEGEVSLASIYNLIGRVRQKLGPDYILNRRGLGYRISPRIVQGHIKD